ncbi:MAG: DinB family protein [Vicinamibacteria bacterium]
MQATLDRLEAALRAARGRLDAIGEEQAGGRPAGMTWSRKQLLGHLIDSASNNHQRFVRSQLAPAISFPPYEQDGWIRAQGYEERRWADLVELWHSYNRHLLHVMSRVPVSALANECVVQEDEPTTLRHHMTDYVVHLEHHLGQILA